MKLIVNEKQKYLIGVGYHLLVKEMSLPPEKAKKLLFDTIVNELKKNDMELKDFDSTSRAERHTFIRKVADKIGEDLITIHRRKKVDVTVTIANFMKLKNQQSQLTNG